MDEPAPTADPGLFKDRVGHILRTSRERAALELTDIASRTRIPLRHLTAIEASDYSQLPSPTYSVGFVKSYARVLGLNEAELGRDLRIELGQIPPPQANNSQHYQPADPARIAPKWLAITFALLALLVFGGYEYWRHYASTAPDEQTVPTVTATDDRSGTSNGAAGAPVTGVLESAAGSVGGNAAAPPSSNPPTSGPVVLTATHAVWLRIYDAHDKVLLEKEMQPNETFTVPPDADSPQIRTGAAEFITVTVGGKIVAPLGTAQHIIKDVGVSATALLARAPSPAASATGAPARPPLN